MAATIASNTVTEFGMPGYKNDTLRLPQTDLHVSPICFGVADLGTRLSIEDSLPLMDAFVERCRCLSSTERSDAAEAKEAKPFFDSAHVYAIWTPNGLGVSERALGEFVKRRALRDEVVIATKGGHPDLGPDYPRPPHFLAPELIARDIEESLERLQMDTIDLYYLHRDDGVTPVGEILDALAPHVAAGRLRYLGASNWSVERVLEANAWAAANHRPGFVALQNQWSLGVPTWKPTPDPTVRYITPSDRTLLAHKNLAVIPYSATSNGYFAVDEDRGAFGSPENAARRERARTLAAKIGATPNQIAIAWLLAQPLPVVPIVGTTKIDHLRDALGAMKINLSTDERAFLEGPQLM